MKTKQVRVKTTQSIIAEAGEENYFRMQLFPSTSLGDYQEKDSTIDIRMSFYDDIAKKYELPREMMRKFLQRYDVNILRALAVFGDHMYIVDKIRSSIKGSF